MSSTGSEDQTIDFSLDVIPVTYVGKNEIGDFEWMIRQPKLAENSLFIFNDNVEDHLSSGFGMGNAAVRPYNRHGRYSSLPRSVGIPTGYSRRAGGFTGLTPEIRKIIDDSIDEIRRLVIKHGYRRIFFSADSTKPGHRPQIGTSIFKVNPEVISYITDSLYELHTPSLSFDSSSEDDS